MIPLVDDIVELRVPSKPEYVSIVRTLITDLAEKMAFSASAVEDVQVAISEACANVVCHAYPDDDHDSEILIRCSTCDDRLVVEVSDTGSGFAGGPYPRSHRPNGGLGLVLIRNLMDQVSLNSSPDEGTIVCMVKQQGAGPVQRTSSHQAISD